MIEFCLYKWKNILYRMVFEVEPILVYIDFVDYVSICQNIIRSKKPRFFKKYV